MKVNKVIASILLISSFLMNGCFSPDEKYNLKIILEYSNEDIITELASGYLSDPEFRETLALARKKQIESEENFIVLFAKAFEELNPEGLLATYFNTRELRDFISYNSTNKEVVDVLKHVSRDAMDNTLNILMYRLDNIGISKRNRNIEIINNRIHITLSSISENPERITSLLTSPGKFEFWETFDNQEMTEYLFNADQTIRDHIAAEKEPVPVKTIKEETITNNDELKDNKLISLIEQIDSEDPPLNLSSETLKSQYPFFSLLSPQINFQTGEPYPGPAIGHANSRDTITINSYIKIAREKQSFPRDVKFLWSAFPIREIENDTTDIYTLYAIKAGSRDGSAPLAGDCVVSAKQEFDRQTGNSYVLMNMNTEGTKKWALITRENIGRALAIVIDDKVYSAPTVQSEITGGASQISGVFSKEEAQDLANIINSSAFGMPFNISIASMERY